MVGPILSPVNGHSYYLLTASTWTAAEAEALTLGGHLATVRNAAEDQWIYDTFSSFGGTPRSLWIGLSDAAVEGTMVWASGEPVAYTNWRPGEPNNVYGAENWVLIQGPTFPPLSTWNDFTNSNSFFGEVINGVVEVPEPTTTLLVLLATPMLLRRRCA